MISGDFDLAAAAHTKTADPKARRSRFEMGATHPATVTSTLSTHSGKKAGSRFDQPGAVAAASLIDWSKARLLSWGRGGRAAAPQKAPGSHGLTAAPIRRS